MRYFLKISYRGTAYCGWQYQTNGLSIQQVLEEALSKYLRQFIRLTGCGRTDAGVHATEYYAHFDIDNTPPQDTVRILNLMLPPDVAVSNLILVPDHMHARFDAIERTYRYFLTGKQDPLRLQLVYFYYDFKSLNFDFMQEAASTLLNYREFLPFCKTGSKEEHYRCDLFQSFWSRSGDDYIYEVSANRFLRGMVRLIAGMCLLVGKGTITVEEVKNALESQKPLIKAWSLPPSGLYLTSVKYKDWNLHDDL